MNPESDLRAWKLVNQAGSPELEPVALPAEVRTLDGASTCLPGGAYTTLRTYAGHKVLRFSEHVWRLEQTARLAGEPQTLDEQALRLALRSLLAGWPEDQEARLRLTLDLERSPGDLYLAIEPLVTPPPQAYQQGVRAITCDLHRQLPKAKLTRFIERSAPLRRSLPPDVNEAIMVDSAGHLLEGLSSNFFAVLGGELWTAEQDVLSGITRGLVLECARQAGVPLRLEPPRLADLPRFAEAFITSASRGVLPLRQIDQVVIGPFCPGPITRSLIQVYQASIEALVEPL